MNSSPILQAKQIGKHFGSHWIFRNLNLSIQRGESVVLLGPSGSGKSVFLKLIAGLLEPDEGGIFFPTASILKPRIGMLFQQNALFDSMTAEENLLLPQKECLGITGHVAQKKADYFLNEVGLGLAKHLYPSELSGGMQKRLGVARALILSPDLLLYDEPTAGLDPVTSKKIAELLIRLKQETKSTLLTVTNEIGRAYQIADRIFLLAGGNLREGGTPDETRISPDPWIHQFVRGEKNGPVTESQPKKTPIKSPIKSEEKMP